MIDKLCVCGHAMEDRGAQTLEMNGSYLGSGLSTDYVDVKVFVCPWCGRMASLYRWQSTMRAFPWKKSNISMHTPLPPPWEI